MFTEEQIEEFMLGCISLALKHDSGIHKPFVGAIVLDKNKKLAGIGTKKFIPGTKLYTHAERNALYDAKERAKRGTLVSTLEPCVIVSKRSQILDPCATLIVNSGIENVIIGLRDSGGNIDGKGIAYLEEHGVEVQIYSGYLYQQLTRLLFDQRDKKKTDTYINPF